MHKCVYVFDNTYYKITTTNYISETSLYTTFHMYPSGPWPLKILMFACTACDPWDNNIQLTMVKDRRWQIYPNVVQCLTLILVDCHHKCHLIKKLTTTQNNGQSVLEGDMMMWGMNTRLPTLFHVMISISMTRSPNLLIINLIPLHNPIDWLRFHNKRISTPTLSSNLWFAIPLNCKVFRNSTRYNESIETPTTTLAPSSIRVKEFLFRYVCNSLDSDSRIALLISR